MQRRRRDQKLKRNDSQTFKYNSFKQLFLQCICFSEVATRVVLKKLFLIISQYSKKNTCVLRWSFFLIKLQIFHRMKTSIKASCTNNTHGGKKFLQLLHLKDCELFLSAYRNSWTLDAKVGLWALDSGRWTLDPVR